MGEIKKKKNPIGPPVKLNKELIEKIANYLRAGAYVETAAQAAGIHRDSFYVWMKKGATAKSGLCKQLNDTVSKAVAESQLRDLAVIDKHANGSGDLKSDWRAAAWRLERRNFKQWGPKQALEHTGEGGGPQVVLLLPANGSEKTEESDE